MKNKLTLICMLIGVVAVSHFTIAGRTSQLRRMIRSENGTSTLREKPKPENEPCLEEAPCGWAVYVRFTRILDYFVYNCKCQNGTLCTQDEDDLSATAYVYKCRPNNATTATAAAAENSTTVGTLN